MLKTRVPSVAVALGFGALVVMAAGSAVAVPSVRAAINGSSIANHSITGAKLKNNTLTGKQINESKLGIVPEAAQLGGKRVFHHVLAMKAGAPGKTIGTFGPLTFTATCVKGSGTTTTATVYAKAVKPVVMQPGMSSLGTYTAASPKQFVVTDSESTASDEVGSFFAYTTDGKFMLSGQDPIDIVINQPQGSCIFFVDLVNHGS